MNNLSCYSFFPIYTNIPRYYQRVMPRICTYIYTFESRKHKQESFLTIGLNQTPSLRPASQKHSQRFTEWRFRNRVRK